ncbi:MAG TPA: M20/M25/M40 family metallo-hydrolase [Thermoanaerobaculia bacterium]|nr:M20/M25/M40 family metallo-hydrolase [Thermoanaerobaculia bacterium]
MIDILRDLIAIDSVNPSLVPGGAGESEIAGYIAKRLRGMRIDAAIEEAAPGRPNVVAMIEGQKPGPSLMLCGHSDTVGVEGMSAPFDPVERDGRMLGRGSQDMKGGVAAILGAAQAIAQSGLRAGSVIVAIVADEEYASIGAEALVKEWTADAAVIAEPTDLAVGAGHKGFEWVEITTEGVAAHGSRHEDGVDAIVHMGRVLARLERLERSFATAAHPLLGRPSLHASLISGGRELSTYPDRCTLHLERRTIEGEAPDVALRETERLLDELRAEDPRFRASARSTFTRAPYVTPRDHPLPSLLPGERQAMSFWTDAAILGAAGIPTVVFGPGGAGLHGIDEYVRVDEVVACRDALVALTRTFCEGGV